VGSISGDVDKQTSFRKDATLNPYIGAQGMQSLVQDLCQNIEVRRPVWVSEVRWYEGAWQLHDGRKSLGSFTYIVIAHNGKCADRLMSKAGVPRIHKLLRAKFGPKLKSPKQDIMQLVSVPRNSERLCLSYTHHTGILIYPYILCVLSLHPEFSVGADGGHTHAIQTGSLGRGGSESQGNDRVAVGRKQQFQVSSCEN
jgi:hypothetical protein